MQQAVYDLTTIAPYVPPNEKFTPAEHVVYHKGFYQGIARALRVMQLAIKLHTLRRRPLRAELKRKGAA